MVYSITLLDRVFSTAQEHARENSHDLHMAGGDHSGDGLQRKPHRLPLHPAHVQGAQHRQGDDRHGLRHVHRQRIFTV